jgi:hypothetical protein
MAAIKCHIKCLGQVERMRYLNCRANVGDIAQDAIDHRMLAKQKLGAFERARANDLATFLHLFLPLNTQRIEHKNWQFLTRNLYARRVFKRVHLPRFRAGAAGFDEQGLGSNLGEPVAHDLCRHLSAIVGSDVFGYAAHEHDVSHGLEHTEAVDLARHPDGQTFAGELIDQGHQPELAAVVGLGLNEVVAPPRIASLRPQPDAGAIVEPKPAVRPLFHGYFEPLTAPDPLHPIAAHIPPGPGTREWPFEAACCRFVA